MNTLNKVNTFCLFTLTLISIAMALIYTKTIMIPFVLSVFLYLIISPFLSFLQHKTRLNRSMSLIITISLFIVITSLLILMLNSSIQNFLESTDIYKDRLANLKIELTQLLQNLGLNIDKANFHEFIDSIPVVSILKKFTGSMLNILSNSFLVIIFTIFLLTGDSKNPENETFLKIKRSLAKYVSLKLILSLATGILTYIVLLSFSVELASMFALLTILLNFIPNIGSIIAVVLPLPILFLQFSFGWQLILILSLLILFQTLVGNIIEPKLLGESIGLHPVVILLSLTFWGFIWGLPGMFLSVPISASLKIIFESFSYTKNLALIFEGKFNIS